MKWNAPRRLFIISYPTCARGIIEFHCIKNSNTYWLLHDGKLSSGSSVQSFLFLDFSFELALYTYFYDWKGRYLEMIIIFVIFVLWFLFCNIFFNLLNFYPVTCFLVMPLLVTALLCLVTPLLHCSILYFVKRNRKRQWPFAFTSQERNLSWH